MDALTLSDDYLDRGVVRHWAYLAAERLAQHQRQIDAVNVFPVADHDTGTNLAATMSSGVAALRGSWADTAAADADALLKGLVAGAQGVSGVVLVQFWRAVAETIARRRLDAAGYAEALAVSVVLVGEAVADPVEGTAWSVLRAAPDRAG